MGQRPLTNHPTQTPACNVNNTNMQSIPEKLYTAIRLPKVLAKEGTPDPTPSVSALLILSFTSNFIRLPCKKFFLIAG
jgi:hypothetical protein